MPSLKDLRNRIASVKATQKITKAMQMVAAAKLRRAQEAAVAARPFSQRMDAVLANLAAAMGNLPGAPQLLTGTGSTGCHLFVVCTAERGLCGAFNASIARLARDHADRLIREGDSVKILCVGRKGFDILKRNYGRLIIDTIELRGVRQLSFANARAIADRILALFHAAEFDVCTLFYSEFKSVITQVPTALQIVPVKVANAGESAAAPGAVYEYEPSEEEILADLLPRNIAVQVLRALLARMSAMDNATRNAGDMINRLTLNYNRQRQAQITKELIEIISGAEAL
jgi:F-type H+-transporting ATPase subunit gamma